MPRPKNPVPPYLRHKATGQAYVKVPDGSGGHKFVYLGKHGTEASRAAYEQLLAELRVGRPVPTPARGPSVSVPPTVDQVLLVFLKHADRHYRRGDGTPTREVGEFRQVAGFVRRLYGRAQAVTFGPLALKAVRGLFLEQGWCRRLVNKRTNRVRHIFKWAAGEELVPGTVWQNLRAVEGFQAGRTTAPETEPVGPVPRWVVHATLPHLRPEVAAMVEFQRLTGCRPGDVIRLRPVDIDTTRPVWVFRPHYHKLTHKQKARTVPIGPRAQAVIAALTPTDPSDYYFSPRRTVARLHAERSAARATPRYRSHLARNALKRVSAPVKAPNARYTGTSYGRAVARAVMKANRALIEAGVEVEFHVPHWHPNQLRHSHGTEVRAKYGLEGAQVALGHERADVTQVYAARDLALAVKIASEIG